MKKSVLSYAFLFSVGQMFAPAVSYSNETQYSGQGSSSPAYQRTGVAEPSQGVLDERARQRGNLYAPPANGKSGDVCAPGSSPAPGSSLCFDNETGVNTEQILERPAAPAAPAENGRREVASDGAPSGPSGGGGANGSVGGDDMRGQQLDSELRINAAISNLTAAYTNGTGFGGVFPSYQAILAAQKKYMADKPTCVSRHDSAASACLEHLSPNILTGVTALNTLLSTAGGAAVKDSCSGFARAMDLAKAAMTAYTAACGTMKAGCGLSCVSARKSLEAIKSAIASDASTCAGAMDAFARSNCLQAHAKYKANLGNLSGAVAEELNQNEKKSIAGKAGLCTEKYANLLTSGITGIISLMNAAKQGDKCAAETDGTGTGDADACKVAATANTEACICKVPTAPECVCLKNPRNPGCPGASDNGSASGPDSYARLSGNNKTTMPDGTQKVDLGGFNKSTFEMGDRNPTSEANGAPPPTGGGSAGLGGGGGSGGGSGGDGAGKKGLNANILGGTGGGGGSWRAGGSGAGANSKYRSYLPGGDKDPNKLAGQQSWTKEVTGQGGKSNWEKVKDRYRDNKNTLLNN